MMRNGALLSLILVAASAAPAMAQIITNSARTERDQGSAVRISARNTRVNSVTGTLRFDSTVIFAPFPDSTFFLNTPFLLKDGRFAGNEVDHDGFGDITLGGKYRILREDDILETTQVSFLGGVKFPVGDDDETKNGRRLPPSLQLGTGSFDFFTGVAFTHQVDRIRFDADFIYQLKTEANDIEIGDVVKLDVAFTFRLTPDEFPDEGNVDQVNLVMEVLTQFQEKAEIGGRSNDNSGGTLVFLAPGLQYIPESGAWLGEVSFQWPVLRSLNGNQDAVDWGAFVGVRIFF